MPFGKYEGRELWSSDPKIGLPDAYVIWLLDQPDLSPTIREICRKRLGLDTPPPCYPPHHCLCLDADLEATLIRRWRRIMAHEFGEDNAVVQTGSRVLQTVLEHAAENKP